MRLCGRGAVGTALSLRSGAGNQHSLGGGGHRLGGESGPGSDGLDDVSPLGIRPRGELGGVLYFFAGLADRS